MAKLNFELIENLELLKNDWNRLIDKLAEPEIFYRYEWASNYIKYYEPGRKVCIVAGRAGDGNLICLLPFSYDNKAVSFIIRESADYNSVYVDPEYNRYYIISKAIDFLLQSVMVTKVCLLNMKGNSELFLLQDIWRANGFSTFLEESVVAPYLLPNTPVVKVNKSRLKAIERHEKQLLSRYNISYNEIQYLDKPIIEFIKTQRNRKYGNNSLNKDNVIDFYIHLADELNSNSVVNTMYADNRLVAAHFGYRTGKKFYYYIPVYDDAFSEYGVGIVLLKHIIEENKNLVFDFLKGNETYKFYWCDNATMNFHLLAYKKDKDGLMPMMFEKVKNNRYIRKLMGR